MKRTLSSIFFKRFGKPSYSLGLVGTYPTHFVSPATGFRLML